LKRDLENARPWNGLWLRLVKEKALKKRIRKDLGKRPRKETQKKDFEKRSGKCLPMEWPVPTSCQEKSPRTET